MEREEQRRFFQQMLLDCYKLWSWEFDDGMGVLYTNSPSPGLHSQLLLGRGRREALLRHVQGNGRPVIVSDNIGLMWAVIYQNMQKDDIPRCFYALGPIFTGEVSRQSMELLLQPFRLSVTNKNWLMNCLEMIPGISTVVFFQQIIMLHYYVTGETIRISDFVYHNSKQGSGDEEQDFEVADQNKTRKKEILPHSPLVVENALLDMVRTGNLEYHSALADAGASSPGIRTKGGDPICQAKYSVVAFITLCSRAAIEGGLSSECAYTLCDTYTQSVDHCTTISQIAAVSHTMYDDFIIRVNQQRRKSGISRAVRICCDYIDIHPTDNLELQELAAMVGYTGYYLSRKFKKEMGVSVNAYIRSARLRQARILLTESRMSVQEISDRLHFCSRSYFADAFRKSEGISPNDYRVMGERSKPVSDNLSK